MILGLFEGSSRGQVCNRMHVKMWDFYDPYRTKSFISNHSWQTTIVQLIGQGSKMKLPRTDRDLLPSSELIILQVYNYLISNGKRILQFLIKELLSYTNVFDEFKNI